MKVKKRPIIIDTDPGIDDAIAIAIALNSEALDVKLITTVVGNVSLDKVTTNALKLLTYWGIDVPVAMGAREPLIEHLVDASNVHGETGMDGFDFPEVKKHNLLKEHAVEAMKRVIMTSKEKVTLVPIGPLTNIALLFRIYPEVKEHIEEVVLMGGNVTRGNKGVLSEFNIATDPEAARIVFESGLPLVMCPLDVGWKALVYPEDSVKIKDMGENGRMIYALLQRYRGRGLANGLRMYDATAIAYLLAPEMFEVVHTHVAVDITSPLTRGATLVDLRGYLGREPNCHVCVDLDGNKFKDWILKALSKCK